MSVEAREHWESLYRRKRGPTVSWYRAHLDLSLAWIEKAGLQRQDPIIDVGGGASTLVDDLIARGHTRLTVLDVSEAALAQARARLGERAAGVHWLCADMTRAMLPRAHFRLWHDRAAFHFLTEPEDRRRYCSQASEALAPGGRLILASFAPDGPERCSGRPVRRYDTVALAQELGADFEALEDARELHVTPAGAMQAFSYVCLRRREPAALKASRTSG
ncbi:MAG TPA: class I SAM-dependent methyltransferase [Steroidobacteraceae bacterium]|nr:class I SAM-dependent methyltransferase [Steroidobacteraceae bacterium]